MNAKHTARFSRGRTPWVMRHARSGVPILAAVSWCTPAHADLQDDVVRLLASVPDAPSYHLGPRILEQGDELPLLPPPSTLSAPARGCTHLIVIGAQSVHFSLEIQDEQTAETPESSVTSRAGLIELVRCGDARRQLARASVTMLSMRGPLDAIAVSNPRSLPIAEAVLPNRRAGDEAPERTLPRQPELPRLRKWLDSLEAKAQLQGATRTERRDVPVEDKGLGETLVGFDPGCHELQLLADVDWENIENAAAGVDLVWQDDREIAARESLQTRSPTLRVCTARARTGQLRFPSLPQSVAGVLFRARYEWPAGVPSFWSASVRSRIAEALFQKHVRTLSSAPVTSRIGGGSSVSLVLPVAPHACYVAVVASITPTASDVSLDVMSGVRLATDTSLDDSAASAAFCQDTQQSVTLGIDARESKTTWIFGLWNVAPLRGSADFR